MPWTERKVTTGVVFALPVFQGVCASICRLSTACGICNGVRRLPRLSARHPQCTSIYSTSRWRFTLTISRFRLGICASSEWIALCDLRSAQCGSVLRRFVVSVITGIWLIGRGLRCRTIARVRCMDQGILLSGLRTGHCGLQRGKEGRLCCVATSLEHINIHPPLLYLNDQNCISQLQIDGHPLLSLPTHFYSFRRLTYVSQLFCKIRVHDQTFSQTSLVINLRLVFVTLASAIFHLRVLRFSFLQLSSSVRLWTCVRFFLSVWCLSSSRTPALPGIESNDTLTS